MAQEISINLDPAIDLDFQRLNKVSQVYFDPSLFNWGLNFGDFDLNLLQISNLFIEQVKVGDEFSASFEKNVLSLDFLFSLDFFNFGLI